MTGRITSQPFSAREVIDALRVEAAEVTREALALSPESREQTAARLGCSSSRVSQYVDGHHDATIRIHEAAALPPVAAKRLAQWIVGEGHVVVALGESDDLGDDMRHAVELQRASSTALAAQLEAIADGHITAAEGSAIEDACEELLAATLRVRAVAKRAQRERVIATRRIGAAR